jgi:NAD(P)-dependent dehydrogenase (short-subunit alcohol dehydrogenase family)
MKTVLITGANKSIGFETARQLFAARVVRTTTLGPDGPTGQFFSDDNSPETGISAW